MASIDDLKKLSPKERISKLKELQEKDKAEIEAAQKLISSSEEEVVREDQVRNIPIPQVEVVNIDELFTSEEKELFKAKRQVVVKDDVKVVKRPVRDLEDVASEGSSRDSLSVPEQRSQAQYLSQLSEKPAENLYSRMKSIYNQVKESGYMSAANQQELSNIHYANKRKLDDIQAGRYTGATKEVAREMVITEKMRGWLQDSYGRKSTNW